MQSTIVVENVVIAITGSRRMPLKLLLLLVTKVVENR